MNSPLLTSRGLVAILTVLLAPAWPAHAAEQESAASPRPAPQATVDAEKLVITKGTLVRGNDRMPATLRNVIDVVSERYPDANITLVGVEDIVIEDVTLRWAARKVRTPDSPISQRVNPPLEGVLVALAEASGRKFRPSSFGPEDFLLSPAQADAATSPPERHAEVFYVGFLTEIRRDPQLEAALREAEVELETLEDRYTEKHPMMVAQTKKIAGLRSTLAGLTRSPAEFNQRLDQIQEVVTTTLQRLNSAAAPPQFQFHPGARLLIVIGSPEALAITGQVIGALRQASP